MGIVVGQGQTVAGPSLFVASWEGRIKGRRERKFEHKHMWNENKARREESVNRMETMREQGKKQRRKKKKGKRQMRDAEVHARAARQGGRIGCSTPPCFPPENKRRIWKAKKRPRREKMQTKARMSCEDRRQDRERKGTEMRTTRELSVQVRRRAHNDQRETNT